MTTERQPVSLTYDEAVSLLERAVAEKGADYVYPRNQEAIGVESSCDYVRNGQPSCIVGHVLNYKGIDLEWLHGFDTSAGSGVYVLHDSDVLWTDTDETLRLLYFAQRHQDSGLTWGEAVERAKNPTDEDLASF